MDYYESFHIFIISWYHNDIKICDQIYHPWYQQTSRYRTPWWGSQVYWPNTAPTQTGKGIHHMTPHRREVERFTCYPHRRERESTRHVHVLPIPCRYISTDGKRNPLRVRSVEERFRILLINYSWIICFLPLGWIGFLPGYNILESYFGDNTIRSVN